MKTLAAALFALPVLAQAHEGHGMFGPHWHATDAWGFVIAVAAGAAVWWMGRK